MKNNENVIIDVNKKRIIFILVAICFFLLVGFIFDDYKYWNSLLGFNKNDEYSARAIEAWDLYGCCYFYKEKQEEALDNYESILKDEKIVGYVKRNASVYGFISLYSDQQIKDSFNAIVYGCNDSAHDTGKYQSVADIPERLFRNCYMQLLMPNNMDESIKEVYDQYLRELKSSGL